ncbi:hypothetical protein G6L00_16575 [Agrobacterium rhizogenes]|nr:hypothetical protein [Rhizobium rhizogenes]
MTTPYTTGTITLTNGTAVVTGAGTAWQTALIVGGIIYAEAAGGNSMPILTVDSDTQITAAVKWKGATGSYSYALVIDTAYDRQVLANATTLAQIIQALNKPSVSALSSLTPANNKLPWFNGANTAALADFTAFARTLLDDTDASTALTTLGVSTFIKTLLDDADASTALSTLGVSAYAKTLLDDADGGEALTTLGVSAFIKTLLDDADQGAARTTLGAQASLGFTPVNKAGDTGIGSLTLTAGKTLSIPTSGSNTGTIPPHIDGSGGIMSIANGAFMSPVAGTFSGIMIFNSHTSGAIAVVCCGGGLLGLMGTSNSGNFVIGPPAAGQWGALFDSGNGRYYVINGTGATHLAQLFLIRTRPGP